MSQAYTAAGVNIDAADRFVERIQRAAKSTLGPHVLAGVGGFAAHLTLPAGMRSPVIVTSTDGVGTKLKVAIDARKYDTIGIDLVAMCVNDIACSGATPLCFLDYFAVGALQPEYHAPIIEGIAAACRTVTCSLVGGETAEMPGLYHGGDFDLAGFVIGVCERDQLLDGRTITPSDILIGVSSTGFHSNGYALIRKVVAEAGLGRRDPFPGTDHSVEDTLLRPTALYSPLTTQWCANGWVKGLAHITGGGLTGNVPRMLPDTCQAVIDWIDWPLPPEFRFIQEQARIADDELRTVLNCGVGLVAACAPAYAEALIADCATHGLTARPIGTIAARPVDAEPIRYVE